MKSRLPNLDKDENLLLALGVVAFVSAVFLALAAYAFILPAKNDETRTLASYRHTANYSYTVRSDPSVLNPSGLIGPVTAPADAGEAVPPPAIFTSLANFLDFTFTYQLQGVADVEGTMAADLEIRSDGNLTQRQELAGPTPFEGATGTLQSSIDLKQIGDELEQLQEQTGSRLGKVELVIDPVVTVNGSTNGEVIDGTFTAPFSITYDDTQITPDEVLRFEDPGAVTRTFDIDTEIGVAGLSAPVSLVRLVAAPIAAIGVLLTGLLTAAYFLGFGRSEAGVVRSRYRSLLVPVDDVESSAGHRISVSSIHDLAQLAKREGRSIFVREFGSRSRSYLVHDGMVIYEYAVGDVPRDWIKGMSIQDVADSHDVGSTHANGTAYDSDQLEAGQNAGYQNGHETHQYDEEIPLADLAEPLMTPSELAELDDKAWPRLFDELENGEVLSTDMLRKAGEDDSDLADDEADGRLLDSENGASPELEGPENLDAPAEPIEPIGVDSAALPADAEPAREAESPAALEQAGEGDEVAATSVATPEETAAALIAESPLTDEHRDSAEDASDQGQESEIPAWVFAPYEYEDEEDYDSPEPESGEDLPAGVVIRNWLHSTEAGAPSMLGSDATVTEEPLDSSSSSAAASSEHDVEETDIGAERRQQSETTSSVEGEPADLISEIATPAEEEPRFIRLARSVDEAEGPSSEAAGFGDSELPEVIGASLAPPQAPDEGVMVAAQEEESRENEDDTASAVVSNEMPSEDPGVRAQPSAPEERSLTRRRERVVPLEERMVNMATQWLRELLQ
jgi:hypothetical protein